MTARSGTMEIATSVSDGYMEITFANTRDRKSTLAELAESYG